MMRSYLFLVCLFLTAVLPAQDITSDTWKTFKPADAQLGKVVLPADTPDTTRLTPIARPGEVKVDQSAEIGKLVERYTTSEHTLKGFRVQIFLGERNEANKKRSAFLLKYPDSSAYLSWLAPNFRVRVGDFMDRMEAERFRYQIRNEFPGCYIVPDEIEPPVLPRRN